MNYWVMHYAGQQQTSAVSQPGWFVLQSPNYKRCRLLHMSSSSLAVEGLVLDTTPNQLQTDRNETQVLSHITWSLKKTEGKKMKSIELERQNEVDWTWKVKITNAEFLAVGKAYMYTYKSLLWPTPYLKGNFKTSLKLRNLSFINYASVQSVWGDGKPSFRQWARDLYSIAECRHLQQVPVSHKSHSIIFLFLPLSVCQAQHCGAFRCNYTTCIHPLKYAFTHSYFFS